MAGERLTADGLLRAMHFHRPGVKEPRRLVVTAAGYDWEARPPEPPCPANWTGSIPLHTWDERADEYTAHNVAVNRWRDYPRDWPAMPAKAVRQALRQGWLAEVEPGILAVTPAGRARRNLLRFGSAAGPAPGPPRWRPGKRRPQGRALLISRYRWHVQGLNRGGSTPQPPPHLESPSVTAWRQAGCPEEWPPPPPPPPPRKPRPKGGTTRHRRPRTPREFD
jgi:hypothetical protein